MPVRPSRKAVPARAGLEEGGREGHGLTTQAQRKQIPPEPVAAAAGDTLMRACGGCVRLQPTETSRGVSLLPWETQGSGSSVVGAQTEGSQVRAAVRKSPRCTGHLAQGGDRCVTISVAKKPVSLKRDPVLGQHFAGCPPETRFPGGLPLLGDLWHHPA